MRARRGVDFRRHFQRAQPRFGSGIRRSAGDGRRRIMCLKTERLLPRGKLAVLLEAALTRAGFARFAQKVH